MLRKTTDDIRFVHLVSYRPVLTNGGESVCVVWTDNGGRAAAPRHCRARVIAGTGRCLNACSLEMTPCAVRFALLVPPPRQRDGPASRLRPLLGGGDGCKEKAREFP